MNVYELPIASDHETSRDELRNRMHMTFPVLLLVKYVRWFCHFRFIIITVLALYGMLGFYPGLLLGLGFRPNAGWALVTASILLLLNAAYLLHLRSMSLSRNNDRLLTNIWLQVVIDLVILTGVIHYTGSLETFLPFAYLFHIVLACIFFPRRQSFAVTALVCVLYLLCVSAEYSGILPSAGLFADQTIRNHLETMSSAASLNIISALGIWLVVWYLASYLSNMVRKRDYELAVANQNLKEAQEARTKHLLRITHELKAPFAAIDANIQLLLKGHCGYFSDDALDVLDRISARSNKLGHEIQEMLQLANLNSVRKDTLNWDEIDLAGIIRWALEQIRPLAENREIRIEDHLEPVFLVAVEDHMKMLFLNLLSNAVIYSYRRGDVRVELKNHDGTEAMVTIEDHGIGISHEKLPKIFDEYYRTDEAVRHNKNLTGLGLAIVRNVAQSHMLGVRVASMPGSGTTFEIRFPSSQQVFADVQTGITKREKEHALYIDH